MKSLDSDNGDELSNNETKFFCSKSGIVHSTTAPYSPQANGVAEHMNRTIIENFRTVLTDSKLNKRFWAEAAYHTLYILNMIPHGKRKLSTMELLTGRKPDLSHLRIFGCLVREPFPQNKITKLYFKSKVLIDLGHSCPAISNTFNPKIRKLYWYEMDALIREYYLDTLQMMTGLLTFNLH